MLATAASCGGGESGNATGIGGPNNPKTGALAISVSGLPGGTPASVTVSSATGYTRTVAASETIALLAPGAYDITAGAVSAGQDTFGVTPATQSVTVTLGATTPVTVGYAILTGSLSIGTSGLPAGATPQVSVGGPSGFERTVSAGATLGGLVPGTYRISPAAIVVDNSTYTPGTPALDVSVSPSTTPIAVAVPYQLATGALVVAVSGLPDGSNGSAVVTGPGAYQRSVAPGELLANLSPGRYTITGVPVTLGGDSYRVPSPVAVDLAPATTPVSATLAYALASGRLAISVNGLPAGTSAAVTVTGPGNYARSVASAQTLAGLAPGDYNIAATAVVVGGVTYSASPTSRIVAVAASPNAVTASVDYAVSSGSLTITVTGLPQGAPASIAVSGPSGYTAQVTSTRTLASLAPGTYTLSASSVVSGSLTYAPTPTTRTIAVAAGATPASTSFSYALASGALTVTIAGLPANVAAGVTVTGPGAFARAVTSTTTIAGLAAGLYTVAADQVTASGSTYTVNPASASVSVASGATALATVTYALTGSPPPPPPPPSGLNLTIDGMHIQQVVQTYGGSVPLVAGRAGLLRVFVKASATNTAAPGVRVRFYSGSTLTSTITIAAPATSTPQSIAEGTLASSWNYTIPGSLMQPGLRILADVDPTNAVVESSDSDNNYPANGTPATIDVRTVPTFNIRLVPVLQSVNALQGGVTAGNVNSYLALTRALYPINTVDADVRAPFTTNAPALQSSDGNGAWGQILSEVNALRTADGSARYYYGVLKVGYNSGIAGLGYVPGRAAIGWDYLPSASGVMAHELGHNFGRFHAPGCGAGGPDASYPKASGKTEAFGYDIATNALKDTSTNYDLMGYCNPDWISAYTYAAVLAYHAGHPFSAAAALGGAYARRGLLVWGRVQRGEVILEPTFEVNAPPTLPQRPGRHRVQGLGALGEVLFDLSFDGERVADHPDGTAEHFAFVVPFGMMGGVQPARVRLDAGNRHAEFTTTTQTAAATGSPLVQRVSARAVRVRWSDAATRGVLVRHPTTGDILAFARGGDAIVYTAASTLDLVTSDGVRSTRQRVSVAPEGRTPQR